MEKEDSYLKLTKTEETFPDGTYVCFLSIYARAELKKSFEAATGHGYAQDFRLAGHIYDEEELKKSWEVVTGQAYAQDYKLAGHNMPGSMEPLPQGKYAVGTIEWAGGKDNYSASFAAGIGPVFIPIICDQEKRRGEFGIHLDYNRGTIPGTAGCVGLLRKEDMQELVGFLRAYDPKFLYVDWGL